LKRSPTAIPTATTWGERERKKGVAAQIDEGAGGSGGTSEGRGDGQRGPEERNHLAVMSEEEEFVGGVGGIREFDPGESVSHVRKFVGFVGDHD
jgi:hypothetical protein